MLCVSIDTINKIREENPNLNAKVKKLIKDTNCNGMPKLDYLCLRSQPKINTRSDEAIFDGKKFFIDKYNKWRKTFIFSRKKEFKFGNLIKYFQNQQISAIEEKKRQAKETLSTISPLLQQKIEKHVSLKFDLLCKAV